MRKKLFTLLLAMVASVGSIFAESGTCGDNLTWDLTNGVLTISGTGAMTDYDSNNSVPWTDAKEMISSVIISEGVTSIGKSAFSGCTNLASVVFPNTLANIGDYAFGNCDSLRSVFIPNAVNNIGQGAFYLCDSLESINVGADNQYYCSVNGVLFNKNMTALIHYPSGKIDTSYNIPNSVTEIGKYAFYICKKLTSVTIPNSVSYIGERGFYSCSGLTSITIPSSVDSIGYQAFYQCKGLTSVHIDDLSAWCKIKFNNFRSNPTCYAHKLYLNRELIKDLVLPDDIEKIQENAFYGCDSLTLVSIHANITSIGEYAFYECPNIMNIFNYSEIPQTIKYNVFNHVDKSSCTLHIPAQSAGLYNSATGWKLFVKIAYLPCDDVVASGDCGDNGNNVTWKLFCDGRLKISGTGEMTDFSYPDYGPWYSLSSSITSVVINDGVTSIGKRAFSGCTGLTSVTIGNSVTNIGDYAFNGCTGLTSVTIPNSVEIIGDEAFSSCSSLTSMTIGNSVTSIGYEVFNHCTNLVSINVENGNQNFSSEDGVLLNKQKTTIIKYPQGRQGAYTIPNSVTEIGDLAFLSCEGLTSVIIPNSVTRIGVSAFQYCKNLVSVTLPNSVTSIGSSAFSGCSILTSVSIGNSVTSIGNSAFSGCTGLTSVIIPNSVTSIGYDAFYRCYSLASVSIGNSVTSIGSSAFFECIKLSSLSISTSIKNIQDETFWGCSSLKSVEIPEGVTSIGSSAFSGCRSLTNIYLKSTTPPTIRSSTFYNIPTNAIVHVLFGGISAYKNSSYWKDLNIHGPSINQEIMPLSTSCTIRYDVEGIELQSIGISGGEQQSGNVLEYIGLEPNSEYKDVPIVLTSNTGETETVNVSFTTTALELTTKASKPVSSTTAILLAETNMSDAEVSCGFEYKRNDAPADMAGSKVFCPVANGQMAGRLKGLKDDVYYKYRAFYQSAAGNMYYGDWQYIFTGDVAVEFDPILYTYGATVVKETEATISGYALAGSEDFTEQGFEYWAETRANGGTNAPRRMPAALNEHFFVQASGISLRVTLTNLDAGTIYKYRVYGKVGDQYYYGSEQAFTTTGTYTPPTYTITFANWDGATLQSSQVEEGTLPIYTGATPERPEDEQYIYTFNGWSPAVVAATADATYKATFSSVVKVYTISVSAVNGQVIGGGEYQYGATIDLTAIPDEGYVFDQWSDGVKDNPRTITVTGDAEYTALFTSTVGFENIYTSEPAQKVIIDQKVYILRRDKVYNAQGALVK